MHRLLAAALGLEPLPAAYEDRLGMKEVTDNMNRRHLNSQLAGRASVALHTNIFFKDRVVVETALVMKVRRGGAAAGRGTLGAHAAAPVLPPPSPACAQLRANGVVVLVPRFGLEGTVILGATKGAPPPSGSGGADKPRRELVFDEAQQTLAAADDPTGALRLRIFDEVKVRGRT